MEVQREYERCKVGLGLCVESGTDDKMQGMNNNKSYQ